MVHWPNATVGIVLGAGVAGTVTMSVNNVPWFEVLEEVDNAARAIQLAPLLHPTLVLIANELYGLRGVEAVTPLREHVSEADLPPEILLVSADQGVRAEAYAAGLLGGGGGAAVGWAVSRVRLNSVAKTASIGTSRSAAARASLRASPAGESAGSRSAGSAAAFSAWRTR